MIDIISVNGSKYSFDEGTNRVFKDGLLMTSMQVEPVYSSFGDEELPKFTGLLLKGINSILSLTGKINPITNIESL